MERLATLRAQRSTLVDELTAIAETGIEAEFKAKRMVIAELDGKITRLNEARALSASLAQQVANDPGDQAPAPILLRQALEERGRPARARTFDHYLSRARKAANFSVDTSRHFRSFGEQLQAVYSYYIGRGANLDSRLKRAPTGAGEVDPTGGGFLVQTDFASAIFMLSHDMGEILSRVNSIPISENANGLKIPGVDETSRVTGSRWGGVQSNWAAEGIAGTESRPKFRLIEFDLKKLISKMTVTDELLQDSTALTSIAGTAFSEEIVFMTEDSFWEGTGAGQPLGFLNSSCAVQVAKQSGQTAGTIVKENIDNMWARMWSRSRKNAVWMINQDCEPYLNQMNQAVGTGGQLVYLPPGGLSAEPYATLYGRPLIAVEYASAVGTPGDIALVDWSQYTRVDKGGIAFAQSMHIAFDTDEMRFRITYRVDGKPMWSQPLTPFKGSLTKSPFVTIAQR